MDAGTMQKVRSYLDELRRKSAVRFGITKDEVHTGHAIVNVCQEYPDAVGQIDAVTEEARTLNQTLRRTVKLCRALTKAGLKTEDVIMLTLPNHADTELPIYAGLINGYPVIPVDFAFGSKELDYYFSLVQPKVLFCLKTKADTLRELILNHGLDTLVVVLDDPKHNIDSFILKNEVLDDDVESFTPPTFSLDTPAFLVPTSGTTGKAKVAIVIHTNIWDLIPYCLYFLKPPLYKSSKLFFLLSPPQWITALVLYVGSVLFVFPRVQTTAPLTPACCGHILSKYKPTFTMMSPPKLMELFHSGCCDMTSMEHVMVGGSALSRKLDMELKTTYKNTEFLPIYGMTELFGTVFASVSKGPFATVGKEYPERFTYRLVDPTTGKDITEPNTIGELWIKDSSPFKGYYKNPEETALLYSSDGYLKTGDLLYKDADGYYFFSERLKMLLKYKSSHVYPTELEEVLRGHPAVEQAGVTGIEDPECGDLVTALVALKKDSEVSAKELCDLIARQLTDSKQLRGGVIFVEAVPLTPAFKIDRRKIKEMAAVGKREF